MLRLSFCSVAIFGLAGCVYAPPSAQVENVNPIVPPQVIYRIDDHRFVSLEDYKHCYFGTTYYNDTRQGIRTKFGRGGGIASYRGRLINADPTGQNIVIPSSYPPNAACPDKGCNIAFIYSTDAGRTFLSGGYYMRDSPNPFRDSANYIVAATTDRIYIAEKWGAKDYFVIQYPLAPGIDLRPFRPDEPPRPKVQTPVKGDTFAASRRPNYLGGLRTPSGQEYVSCDDSIRPAKVSK